MIEPKILKTSNDSMNTKLNKRDLKKSKVKLKYYKTEMKYKTEKTLVQNNGMNNGKTIQVFTTV